MKILEDATTAELFEALRAKHQVVILAVLDDTDDTTHRESFVQGHKFVATMLASLVADELKADLTNVHTETPR